MLKLLNKERMNNYSSWLQVGLIIYSLDLPFQLWDQLSQSSSTYELGCCATKWATFKSKSYNKSSLYFLAKKDDPLGYDELVKTSNFDEVYKHTNTLTMIPINKDYLCGIDLNKKLYIEEDMNTYIKQLFNDDFKSLNIKSPYGTSKTQLLKLIIKQEESKTKRILYLSYRQTLTNDLKNNFGELGFQSYLDHRYDADRIIIQLESLMHLETADTFIDDEMSIVPKFDLVIIDEIESILKQFDSSTFKRGQSKVVFEYLTNIIKTSSKMITLDGDMNNRSYNFIEHFGASINLVNTVNNNKKVLELTKDTVAF